MTKLLDARTIRSAEAVDRAQRSTAMKPTMLEVNPAFEYSGKICGRFAFSFVRVRAFGSVIVVGVR